MGDRDRHLSLEFAYSELDCRAGSQPQCGRADSCFNSSVLLQSTLTNGFLLPWWLWFSLLIPHVADSSTTFPSTALQRENLRRGILIRSLSMSATRDTNGSGGRGLSWSA